MYFLVNLTNETYKEIGGLFQMDHTSVIHSKDLIRDLITVDQKIQSDVEAIKRKIIDAHY
jgi:chromosomal replication initiation ATPase DnaA